MSKRRDILLEGLLSALYELAVKSSQTEAKDKILAGHEFEEETARLIYSHEKKEGLKANQPRLTLQMPTISSLVYQFDASFSHRDTLFLVECKKRKSLLTGIELVHYFTSKILDYGLAADRSGSKLKLRGIFMSTQDTGDSGHVYGLSFGVRVIDPTHPPVEFMLSKLPAGETALKQSLLALQAKTDSDFLTDQRTTPSSVYKEYQFLRGRCDKLVDNC
jgi:hypothetical protein